MESPFMPKISLPIDSFHKEIIEKLRSHGSLVLSAEAGAGKSTRVPWNLALELNCKTLVLQPRRVAAQMLAERVCAENEFRLGNEVGYHIRFDRKFSSQTQLIFITEALLKKYIQHDPFLEGIGLVILDEFHERSIHSDIALMMLRKLQSEIRPNLKILVMSATMDSQKVSAYLNNAPIVEVPGRTFPIEVHYSQNKIEDPRDLNELSSKLLALTQKALSLTQTEDILVFLSGAREIQHCQNVLSAQIKQVPIYPLYASLGSEGIRKALSPTTHQKIILSTNIAETSLTLSNLGVVIDTGMVKESSVSLPHLITQLRSTRISQASSNQRKGRAGRTTHGHCFRLWASHDQNFLKEYDTPEIMRSDLSEELPYLYEMDFQGHPSQFPWFEVPPATLLDSTLRKLQSLELIDSQFHLKAQAEKILNSPLSLRSAHFLQGLLEEGGYLCKKSILWASAFEELPIAAREGDFESSVERNYSFIKNSRTYKRISDHHKSSIDSQKESEPAHLVRALCRSYMDRLCRFRKINADNTKREQLLMNGGRGVKLFHNPAKACSEDYLIALDLRDSESQSKDSLVSFYFPIHKESLHTLFSKQIAIKKWSEETPQGLRFWEAKHLQDLPLEEARPSSSDSLALRNHLFQKALADWPNFLKLNSSLEQFWIRLTLHFSDKGKPLSQPHIETLDQITSQLKTLEDLASAPELEVLLLQEFNYGEQQQFKKLFPTEITLPKGRIKPIVYSNNTKATLSIRLQDAFGWKEHPHINNGKIPLRLELLSPAGRPIQITEDIIGFWKGSYSQVRKEMRARYPKHAWPEDPSA